MGLLDNRCEDCGQPLDFTKVGPAAVICHRCYAKRDAAEASDAARYGDSGFTPRLDTIEQLTDAKADLRMDAPYPAWPFRSVQDLVGGFLPERLVFIAANTGQGKTTFVLATLRGLIESGATKVYMLGLEQQPKELRTKIACLDAGVPSHIAFERSWREWPDATARDRVLAAYEAQAQHPWLDRVYMDPVRAVNHVVLRQAVERAVAFGAQVVLVDHIDRLEHGTGSNSYHELAQTVKLCKNLATDHGLTMVCTSQMNREASKGSRLAKYFPPQLHQVFGGSVKEHEGDVWLGLWRPLRDDADPKVLKRAAAGLVEVREVWEPNTMGVICMKHRLRDVEGHRVMLHVSHGRVRDLTDDERRERQGLAHRIATVPGRE